MIFPACTNTSQNWNHRNYCTTVKSLIIYAKDVKFYFKEMREWRLWMEWFDDLSYVFKIIPFLRGGAVITQDWPQSHLLLRATWEPCLGGTDLEYQLFGELEFLNGSPSPNLKVGQAGLELHLSQRTLARLGDLACARSCLLSWWGSRCFCKVMLISCVRGSQRLFLVTSENPAAWKQGGKDLGRPRRLVGLQSESKGTGWETQITEQGLSEAAFNGSPVTLFLD